jgi:hypothetical protein
MRRVPNRQPARRFLHWDARRHRRNLLPKQDPHDKDKSHLDGRNPFHLHGRYIDADAEARSRLRLISFFVGPTFVVGSILFVLGASAAEDPADFDEKWSLGKRDGLINIPYLVRSELLSWCGHRAGSSCIACAVGFVGTLLAPASRAQKWVDGQLELPRLLPLRACSSYAHPSHTSSLLAQAWLCGAGWCGPVPRRRLLRSA